MKESLFALHINQFLVGSRLDANDDGIGGAAGGDCHHGFLNRLKLRAAVCGNCQFSRRSHRAARATCEEDKGQNNGRLNISEVRKFTAADAEGSAGGAASPLRFLCVRRGKRDRKSTRL